MTILPRRWSRYRGIGGRYEIPTKITGKTTGALIAKPGNVLNPRGKTEIHGPFRRNRRGPRKSAIIHSQGRRSEQLPQACRPGDKILPDFSHLLAPAIRSRILD